MSAPKLRVTLLALLLRPNEVVPVDHLVEALWPGTPPSSAAKLVQVYVSQLRSSWDASRWRRWLPATGSRSPPARSTRSGSNVCTPRPARGWRRATPTWPWRVVAGPSRCGAVRPSRTSPTHRSPPARRPGSTSCASSASRIASTPSWRSAVTTPCSASWNCCQPEYPLRERVRQRLALALYRSGRQADALRALAEGRRLLRDELGVDPDADHDRLERAILEHSPDLRVDAHVDAPLARCRSRRRPWSGGTTTSPGSPSCSNAMTSAWSRSPEPAAPERRGSPSSWPDLSATASPTALSSSSWPRSRIPDWSCRRSPGSSAWSSRPSRQPQRSRAGCGRWNCSWWSTTSNT